MHNLKLMLKIFFFYVLMYGNISGQDPVRPLFEEIENTEIARGNIGYRNAVYAKINKVFFQEIISSNQTYIEASIPLVSSGNPTKVNFSEFDLFTEDFHVTTSKTNSFKYNKGKYFSALSEGLNAFGAFSFYDDNVMGVLTYENGDSYNIGSLNSKIDLYAIINDDNFEGQIYCDVDDNISIDDDILRDKNIVARSNKCVNIYLEADYALYLSKGKSVKNTVDYVLGLFAESSLLYKREGVNIKVAKVKVWETPDNYSVKTSNEALDQFVEKNRESEIDLNMLLAEGAEGLGGLAYINALCRKGTHFAYANINSNYKNVPLYSWSAMVITHELGHNLGSRHTHACAWNQNHSQIDDCGNYYYFKNGNSPEGSQCFDEDNVIIPKDGGTIMSYCHLNSVGINLAKGFGAQPRDLILKRIASAGCIDECEPFGEEKPKAYFKAKNRITCEGGVVRFVDLSTQHPSEWFWKMETGDEFDTILNHKYPKLKYDSIGVFDVELIAKNGKGNDTFLRNDYINVIEGPTANFKYSFIDKHKVEFINESLLSDKFYWNFGDNKISFVKNPKHKYKEGGEYVVKLISTRDTCETDSYFQDTIEIIAPYRARAFYNKALVCIGDTVRFSTVENRYDSVQWNFYGAQISGSNELNIDIRYDIAGTFGFELITFSKYGNDTLIKKNVVEVLPTALADFDYSIDNDTVLFFNKSKNSDKFIWDFGTGEELTIKNPFVAIENDLTDFTAKLTAKNVCSSSVLLKEVIITKVLDTYFGEISIFPNPTKGKFAMNLGDKYNNNIELVIYNIYGEKVYRRKIANLSKQGFVDIDMVGLLKSGVYYIKILGYKKYICEKMLIIN